MGGGGLLQDQTSIFNTPFWLSKLKIAQLFNKKTLNDSWYEFLKNISKGAYHLSLLSTREPTFDNSTKIDSFLKKELPQNKYSSDKSKKWSNQLYQFRNLKNKTWIVLLLSIIRNLKNIKIDMYKHVENFFIFSFIYHDILGLKPNNYFTLMWTWATKLDEISNKF